MCKPSGRFYPYLFPCLRIFMSMCALDCKYLGVIDVTGCHWVSE
jgi:hypothetical protein